MNMRRHFFQTDPLNSAGIFSLFFEQQVLGTSNRGVKCASELFFFYVFFRTGDGCDEPEKVSDCPSSTPFLESTSIYLFFSVRDIIALSFD
jgi:hypothetical protein